MRTDQRPPGPGKVVCALPLPPGNLIRLEPEKVASADSTTNPVRVMLSASIRNSVICSTMKFVRLVSLPALFTTTILPVFAPTGTSAFRLLLVTGVTRGDALPSKNTLVTSTKFWPLMVTSSPTGALNGAKEPITGGKITTKFVRLAPVPTALVTAILPVVAPMGIVAVNELSETTLKFDADVPLKVTTVAPVKFSPAIATSAPTVS